MSFFVYRSMTPGLQRFRLVDLLPPTDATGDSTPEISCSVSHAFLERPPSFAALSYNWGSSERSHAIILNGRPFRVTANLHTALRHLRLPNDRRTLWIDALCIDHENAVEKSEQVQQMGQIYACAERVVAWLGAAEDDSDLAMEWIEQFGTRAHNLAIGATAELRLRNLFSRMESLSDEVMRTFLEDLSLSLFDAGSAHLARTRQALAKFCTRPYWSRVWVVQEIVRARSVTFVCGSAEATEDALHHALRLIRNSSHYFMLRETAPSPSASGRPRSRVIDTSVTEIMPGAPIRLLKSRRAAVPFPLMHLLRAHRGFLASDPRDKVFALLGLSSDGEDLGFRIDYSLDCNEVYLRLAALLLSKGYIELFSLCDIAGPRHNVPTWVPLWSHVSPAMSLESRSLDRSVRPHLSRLAPRFSAGTSSQFVPLALSIGDTANASMTIVVKVMGKITSVGAVWSSRNAHQWLADLDGLSHHVYSRPEEELQRLDMVHRTSVADQEIWRGPEKPRLSNSNCVRVRDYVASRTTTLDLKEMIRDGFGEYCQQLKDISTARRPFLVGGEYLGLGSAATEAGDVLCIVQGATVPYLFRPLPHPDAFLLVGEAYAHGLMDTRWDDSSGDVRTITVM